MTTADRMLGIVSGLVGAGIVLFVLIMPVTGLSYSHFNTTQVSDAFDYGKYISRWTDIYNPGEKIKIYVSVEDVNRFRSAALDFVCIIKDPNGYVVSGEVKKVRELGYKDRFYKVFEFSIDDSWIDGKYEADIYVFDVLNETQTYKNYQDLYNEILYSGKFNPQIITSGRKTAPYLTDSIVFYVNRDYDTRPPNTFLLFDSRLKANVLPVGVNNTLSITLLNTYTESQETQVSLLVDGKKISGKNVKLNGNQYTRLKFQVPSPPRGNHTISISIGSDRVKYLNDILPIYVPPLLYMKPIEVGDYGNGSIVYSPNNYILGSVGISELSSPKSIEKEIERVFGKEYSINRESAVRMMTNILAYLWETHGRKGDIKMGILKGSDTRAEKILPEIIKLVKEEGKAPIEYLGVIGYNDVSKADVVVFVGNATPDMDKLDSYIYNGGFLIVDDTSYWSSLKDGLIPSDAKDFEFSKVDLSKRYFDFNVNKTITIKLKSELKLPPKFRYSNLSISHFVANPGDNVRISFSVKNEGGVGKEKVKVLINGKETFSKEIELFTGETRNLNFTFVPEKAGSYKVAISGSDLAKVFFVKAKKPQEQPTPPPSEKPEKKERSGIPILIAGFILALLIILRIYVRRI